MKKLITIMKQLLAMKKYASFALIVLVCASCSSVGKDSPNEPSKEDYTIDFQLEEGRIVLHAKVNDMDSLRFMLDNGSSATIFDSTFWLSLEKQNAPHFIQNIGNFDDYYCPTNISLSDYTYSIDTLYVASEKYSQNHFSALSLNGIIGVELFYKNIVDVDFENQKIHISDQLPENIQDYKQYDMISLHKQGDPYYHKMRFLTVDGLYDKKGEPVSSHFLIDLGSITNNLDYPFCDNIDIEKSKSMASDTTSMIHMLLNKYPMIETVYMDTFADTAHVDNFKNGVIGIAFLKHFNVIFDYPHNKLYLKPNRQ